MVPIHSCRTVLQRAVPLALASLIAAIGTFAAETPPAFSGIYPHLAMFNSQGECGTGALVPWANKLWVVTYSPHSPKGSGDKLYSIDTALQQTIHPESIGGTPANRFIHTESQQLFIVSYQPPPQNRILAVTERNRVAPARRSCMLVSGSFREASYTSSLHWCFLKPVYQSDAEGRVWCHWWRVRASGSDPG